MRKLTSLTLAVVMFSAGLVLTTTPAHAQTPKIKSVETKSGLEVAAKVQRLKRDSLNVKAALRQFERRGHRPKIEEAHSISGAVERDTKGARNYERGITIRKANFAQTIREGSTELIFVPVLDWPTEWQGTLIARAYNEHNQVVSEEVSNLAMVQESSGRWIPVYELSFASGEPYLHHEPGMFSSFALGVPIADHPAVTGSAPDTNLLPWQLWEEPPPPCFLTGMDCPVAKKRGEGVIRPASYREMAALPQVLPIPPQQRFPIRCPSGPCHTDIRNFIDPRIRNVARDAFPACGVSAVVFGGNLSYFVRACSTSIIIQANRHIFHWW